MICLKSNNYLKINNFNFINNLIMRGFLVYETTDKVKHKLSCYQTIFNNLRSKFNGTLYNYLSNSAWPIVNSEIQSTTFL